MLVKLTQPLSGFDYDRVIELPLVSLSRKFMSLFSVPAFKDVFYVGRPCLSQLGYSRAGYGCETGLEYVGDALGPYGLRLLLFCSFDSGAFQVCVGRT